MSRFLFTMIFSFVFSIVLSQKKPLDHSVYDAWQSIGKKSISNNGKWIVYNIDVQEGDNELVIQPTDLSAKIVVPRGSNAIITEDSRYVIFSIKPFYKDTREAKIKKKKVRIKKLVSAVRAFLRYPGTGNRQDLEKGKRKIFQNSG